MVPQALKENLCDKSKYRSCVGRKWDSVRDGHGFMLELDLLSYHSIHWQLKSGRSGSSMLLVKGQSQLAKATLKSSASEQYLAIHDSFI